MTTFHIQRRFPVPVHIWITGHGHPDGRSCIYFTTFHAFVSSAFWLGDMSFVPSPEPLSVEAPFTVHSLHQWGLRHVAAYDASSHLSQDI